MNTGKMVNNIILDFDSTIINANSVDLIIKESLQRLSHSKKSSSMIRLRELTEQVTNGDISLGEALRQRFALVKIFKKDVVKVSEQLVESLNPLVYETIQQLLMAGKQIYVFSTSFAEIVRPVTESLSIAWDHVFTNQLIFNMTGRAVGANEKNPLFLSVGKGVLAEQMKNDGLLPGWTAIVGEGTTDLALRKNNIAQIFVYFAGSQVYEEIREQADFAVDRFNQLLPLFFSEDEKPVLQTQISLQKQTNPAIVPKIIMLENIHEQAVMKFHDAKYPIKQLKKACDEKELCNFGGDAQVLCIRSQTLITSQVIKCMPELWAIGAFCIGINQIDLDAAAHAGIPVFNAPYSNTRSVAELVVGETILLMRRIFEKSSAAHQGIWLKSSSGCTEIRGKTVGIVGYGHIGSQVSVLLEHLGMSVFFHDIVDKLPLGNAKRARNLYDLLEKADIITIHVPDTPETRGMIGAPELQKMKNGAFLINSSRGKVVNLDALKQSLDAGYIAGAAIDVFPKEPNRAEEKFRSVLQGTKNVILTPHIGGSTQEAQENIAAYVSDKILNYLQSGSTLGAVNFPEIDLPRMPNTHRILHIHKNVPGVLAKINSVFGRHKVNVESQILQTRDQIGYLIVDVDHLISDQVIELMRYITETVKIRKIE